MPHFKSRTLTGIGIIVGIGAAIALVLGLDLPVSASPLLQFPINSVRVISDPPPADLPGQFSEYTLLQNHGGDPHPNWRLEDFNDSGWQPSYPVVTQPAWGLPVDAPPPTDFIWGGPPGAGPFAGRYNIPNTGASQYLFIRKNFCIPINADLASVSVVNPASFQIATTTTCPTCPPDPPPGSATITFNGANVVTGLAGDESGAHYPLNLAIPVAAARQLGRNTLALRVRDDELDNTAGVAYNLDFNYAIDPTALTLNSNPPSPGQVNTAVTFSQNNTGLSNDGPYTYAWDFGDGTTSTAEVPTKVYNTPGTYVVRLTMTDRFGCPSAPVTLVYQVLGSSAPATDDDDDDDDDEAPVPTPLPSPTSTPSPSPTPEGPRYLPETGSLDQDQSAANSSAYLIAGTLLVVGFSSLLFFIGYGLSRHWFKEHD